MVVEATLADRDRALLEHLAPAGELNLDFSDEITSGACVAGRPQEAAA